MNKLNIFFCFFIAIFDKEAKIHCSFNSISWSQFMISIQSIRQLQWTDTKATSENLIIFFWKTTSCSKDQPKIYSLLIYDLIYNFFVSKDFQSSYITFVIFNNSTFLGTTENKWTVRHKPHHQFWQPHLLHERLLLILCAIFCL